MRKLFLSLLILLFSSGLALAERDCIGVVYLDPGCNLSHFNCQAIDVGGTLFSVLGLREVHFVGADDLDRWKPYLLLRVWDFDGTVDVIHDFPGVDKFIGVKGSGYGLYVARINLDEEEDPPEIAVVIHNFSSDDNVGPEIFSVPSELALTAAVASDLVLWRYQGPNRAELTAAVQAQYVFDPCR